MTSNEPIYSHVAYDIAVQIASGELKENDRFSGRSLMSSQYGVSPETIRRALRLLYNMGIVSIQQGVGVTVVSRRGAIDYVEQCKVGRDLRSLKAELRDLMEKRAAMDEHIIQVIERISDLSERFRSSDWMRTYEFSLDTDNLITGQSIGDIQFRQNTSATIIAVRREDEIILSPPPDTVLRPGDVLIVACDISLMEQVSNFIARKRHES